MSYEFNHEAEPVAFSLIERYHHHLRKIKIAYVFKGAEGPGKEPVPAKSGKNVVYAKAALVPEKYRLLASEDYEFIIEFTRSIWDRLSLSHQEALVDHELCHCRVSTEDGASYMADHDVEEFRPILVRHGFWRESLRLFIESAQPLFDQPGLQMNLSTPLARTVSVAYGEPVRIVETGEVWCMTPDGWELVEETQARTTVTLSGPGIEPITMTDEQFSNLAQTVKDKEDAAFINSRNSRKRGKDASA